MQDVLKDAMGLVNAIEIDETPSSSDLSIVLRAANVMIDGWSSQNLLLRSDTTITVPLVAGVAGYTIGSSGADVTAPKPIKITSAYITDASMDYPLEIVTKALYDTFEDKNVSQSRPEYLAYDPGATQQSAQKGTVYFYHTPEKSYTVSLECQAYLTEFVNFTDTITFEPAYYEPLIYNLAVRIFRRFSDDKTPIPMDIQVIANEGLTRLKAMNATQVISGVDLPGKNARWNVYTDTVSG